MEGWGGNGYKGVGGFGVTLWNEVFFMVGRLK